MIAASMLLSTSSPAELKHKPWVEKDWTEWTASDCDNVVHYSPWIYFSEGGGRETGPNEGQYSHRHYDVVELSSALPIRQARLRQLQLRQGYDKMNPQKKQDFDQKHAQDLFEGDNEPVRILVYNNFYAPDPQTRVERVPVKPARRAALRLSDGTFVMPLQTILESESFADYLFPRSVSGKAVYPGTEHGLNVVFGEILAYDKHHDHLGPQKPEDFHFDLTGGGYTFLLETLVYKGKLEY
jgi:hypothetical protein